MNTADPVAPRLKHATLPPIDTSVGQSIAALLDRTPELVPLLEAAAQWLDRAAVEARARRAAVAPSPAGEVSSESDTVSLVDLVAGTWDPSTDEASGPADSRAAQPVEAPATTAQLAELARKFSGPAIAPRQTAPVAETAIGRRVQVDPDAVLLDLPRKFGMQRAAIDWWRSRRLHGFDAVKESFFELRRQGLDEQCFMWALDRQVEEFEPAVMSAAAAWYEVLGDALDAFIDEGTELAGSKDAFEFLAATVHEVRQALSVLTGLDLRDQGLIDLHSWVKRNAPRFGLDLRELDATIANAVGRSPELAANELAAIRRAVEARRERRRGQTNAAGQFVYELKRYLDTPSEAPQRVDVMTAALDDLRQHGGSATERTFVDRVERVLGNASLPPAILERDDGRALAIALATRHDESTDATSDADRVLSEDAIRVREALRGKQIVIVGGDERPEASQAIREAFELQDLHWVATRPHESHDRITPAITRPDVDLVVLLIRWASHSFGGLREECDRLEIPFVRLPRGYGVNTLAREILQQVGRRIGAEG